MDKLSKKSGLQKSPRGACFGLLACSLIGINHWFPFPLVIFFPGIIMRSSGPEKNPKGVVPPPPFGRCGLIQLVDCKMFKYRLYDTHMFVETD